MISDEPRASGLTLLIVFPILLSPGFQLCLPSPRVPAFSVQPSAFSLSFYSVTRINR